MQRELDVEEAGEISWPVDCPGHSLPKYDGRTASSNRSFIKEGDP